MSETRFSIDYSKRVSKCKKCKVEIEKGSVRLAKVVPNYFGDGDGELKQYYHTVCLFETFSKARSTTKVIESPDEIEDFLNIEQKDKDSIIELIATISSKVGKKVDKKEKKIQPKSSKANESNSETEIEEDETPSDQKMNKKSSTTDDNKFETFQLICNKIANQSSHLEKTDILRKFFKNGINKEGFEGDMYLFVKLLLPSASTRVFNLNSKQLVKLFNKIFSADLDEMTDHLNKGDVSETCSYYFTKSKAIKPAAKSVLNLSQIDAYLDKLTEITKEIDQIKFLEEIAKKSTANDLRTFVRLIKKDLKIDAMTKIILDSVAPNAYQAFQVSRDLKDVIQRASERSHKTGLEKSLSIKVNLMTPIKPMLADACKSVEQAFVKCKNSILAEIKYDGERLQVHKNGAEFNYFSRNLKQVQAHKVSHLKEFIPKAFPNAKQLILDAEVLLYCSKTKKPLPFGTLGVHKKNAFNDATVCLFVFDCIWLNGQDLINTPLDERRKILEQNMTEIPGRIMFSDQKLVKKSSDLREMILNVIQEGLEGLVLKDSKSLYEPGKRHWLKMKKDYLDSGSMADTADLVVLGAYYGTGNKGGMKSVFLMGSLSEKTGKWYTVTKVGNGFDDKTLEKLQKEIDMVEIKKNFDKVPDWLVINKSLVPDFIVKNPKKSPIWELTGAEFSKSDVHTADGISIRFPRVTKVRDDKSWKEATNLERLQQLFKVSKEKTDVHGDDSDSSPKKAAKRTSASVLVESESEEYESPVKIKKKEDSSSNLPSLFEDKKFFISANIPDQQKLKRYIKAYNGIVIDEKVKTDATHVVVLSGEEKLPSNFAKSVVKITDEKLWECIKKKKILI